MTAGASSRELTDLAVAVDESNRPPDNHNGQTPTRRPTKRMVLAAVVAVVLIVIFAAPIRDQLGLPIFPQDEGLLLIYPSLILHGAIPDHTFDSVYGVTNLYGITLAFKIGGQTLLVERIFGIAFRMLLVGSLASLAWRRRGALAALVAGGLCSVLLVGTWGVAAYSWIVALSLSALSLLMLDIGLSGRKRPNFVVVSGIGFGLAIGARLDMGLAIVAVVVGLFVLRRPATRRLVVGLLIGLVPFLVNLFQAGLPAIVRDQILQPIFVSGPARRLPYSNFSPQELALLVLCFAVATSTLVIGIVQVRRGPPDWAPALLVLLGLFELGILPQGLQRADSVHLVYLGAFVLPAAVFLPAWRLGTLTGLPNVNLTPLLTGVVVLVLGWSVVGSLYWNEAKLFTHQPVQWSVANDGRSVLVGSRSDQIDLTALLTRLDRLSHSGDRVFVGPSDLRTANYNDTYIYFLLPQLTPGSYYLEMNPGVSNGTGSRLVSDLRSDQFLILTTSYNDKAGLAPGAALGPNTPNVVVKDEFRPIGAWGPWTLLERR